MFRSFFIYLSQARWARRIVTGWNFAWQAASRFIAGDTAEDAINAVKLLNKKGINATLDHLGEHTTTTTGAEEATNSILHILEEIEKAGVKASVSIKLTQIGLAIDADLCAQNLESILITAQKYDNFIRLDMEDSPWVDATLNLYRKMRLEKGFENIGVVIQSYLYRSVEDVKRLMDESARVRLCKGAYKEPKDVAFPKKLDVDINFDQLVNIMLQGAEKAGRPLGSENGKIPPIPAIATHDERRIALAKQITHSMGIPKQAIEFQFLFGIRRDLQAGLVEEGYPVRVYVPYGTEWYPYFVRRLAERPANLWFFISNLLRK